jgi:hypothetical protein
MKKFVKRVEYMEESFLVTGTREKVMKKIRRSSTGYAWER